MTAIPIAHFSLPDNAGIATITASSATEISGFVPRLVYRGRHYNCTFHLALVGATWQLRDPDIGRAGDWRLKTSDAAKRNITSRLSTAAVSWLLKNAKFLVAGQRYAAVLRYQAALDRTRAAKEALSAAETEENAARQALNGSPED